MAPDPSAELALLSSEVAACRACPRLVAWREKTAREKRLSFQDEEYWGRPIPGYGDPGARILVIGLAPAAHGGNRTGRIFTGDRSGDWLFASMFRQGLTNQPESVHANDGLTLYDAYVAAAVRCAPPDNKPATDERDRCLPYLVREARLLTRLQVVVALGGFAWDAWLRVARTLGFETPRPKPRFGHLQEATVGPHTLLGSYHPSQQNTFTGRLTEPMLDAVFARARAAAGLPEVTR
jgi:uracil-DNA glycosylase family 4